MQLQAISGLQCIHCQHKLEPAQFAYTCPECGHNLSYQFDYDLISSSWSKEILGNDPEKSLWRYLPLLPVENAPTSIAMQVGGTPLIPYPDQAGAFGLQELWIKDDTRNPSASLKDRATEVALQHARELGLNTVIAASTGNAGASLACLAAYHRMQAILCIPADAPEAKLVQIRQHGATLLPIEANYDTAFDLALRLAEKRGYYCRNTGINPILAEGKKTAALEIAEQLNWEVPDAVLVPVGDGCIISGLYRGFEDLMNLGWIDRFPRLIAVQAEGSAAIVNSLASSERIEPVVSSTVADSISVDLPRDGEKARQAITRSNGLGILVSDAEILDAQLQLSRNYGLFVEPAAAAVMAGLTRMSKTDQLEDLSRVVLLATGSGLKDILHAQQNLPSLATLQPSLDILEQRLDEANHG